MSWVIIAVIAYLVIAIQTILDKFLLSSDRVSHPTIYAFYSGVLSLATLIIFPVAVYLIKISDFLLKLFPGVAEVKFHFMGAGEISLAIFSGAVFTFGILYLFFAFQKNEASRVVSVVGATVPIITFLLSFILFGVMLNVNQIIGVIALIVGGLVISLEAKLNKVGKKFFSGFAYSIIAGILFGLASTIFKKLYDVDSFSNVFLWTRVGLFAGAVAILVLPKWRKIIVNSFFGLNKEKKKNSQTGALFVGTKILGGVGSILLQKSISLGEVTSVNALVSIEYVFILMIGLGLSLRWPNIFHEKMKSSIIIQKVIAIIIISLGLFSLYLGT